MENIAIREESYTKEKNRHCQITELVMNYSQTIKHSKYLMAWHCYKYFNIGKSQFLSRRRLFVKETIFHQGLGIGNNWKQNINKCIIRGTEMDFGFLQINHFLSQMTCQKVLLEHHPTITEHSTLYMVIITRGHD